MRDKQRLKHKLLSLLLLAAMLINLFPTALAADMPESNNARAAETVTVTLPTENYYSFDVGKDQYQSVNGNVYTITKEANFVFTVKLAEGYTQTAIKVSVQGGSEVHPTLEKTYALAQVQGDTVVSVQPVDTGGATASWELNQYDISIPHSGKGYTLSQVTVGTASVSPSGSGQYKTKAEHGKQLIFSITLAEGYTDAIPEASYGGTKIEPKKNGKTITYSIAKITANLEIIMGEVAPNIHQVTFPSQPEGYTIAGVNGATSVPHDGTYQFTVKLAAGYAGTPQVTAKKADSQHLAVKYDSNTGIYSIINVTAPITIDVTGINPAICTVGWKNSDSNIFSFEVEGASPGATSMNVAYNKIISFSLILDQSATAGAKMAVYANNKVLVGQQDSDNSLKYNYTYQVTGNTTLEAKNVTSAKYDISWNVDGVSSLETYTHGDVPVFKNSTAKTPSEEAIYVFTGWAWSEGTSAPSTERNAYSATISANDKFIDVEQKEIMPFVAEERTYYAVYRTEKIGHTVTWVVRNADGVVTTTTKVGHNTQPKYNNGSDPTGYDDNSYTYTFSGWKANGTGNVITSAQLPNATAETTYVAQYSQAAKPYTLNVNYVKSESNLQITLPNNTSVSKAVGESYSVAPSVFTGYHFIASHPLTGKMPAENLTITVTYYPRTDTAYKVEHYQMGTDGAYAQTPTETDNLRGITETVVTPGLKNYLGFGKGEAQNKPTNGFVVAADGSTVIKIYYPRNQYNIILDANGGYFNQDTNKKTISAKVYYDAEIALPTYTNIDRANDNSGTFSYTFANSWQGYDGSQKPKMPAKDVTYHANWTEVVREYTLTVKYEWVSGHQDAGNCVLPKVPEPKKYAVGAEYSVTPAELLSHVANGVFTGKMPARDVTVTIYYAAESGIKYTVEHYKQRLGAATDTSTYEKADTETYVATSGQNSEAVAHAYEGFTAQSFNQQKVSATGVVVKIYYDRQSYDVTWEAGEGKFNDNNSTKTEQVQYGAKIVAPSDPSRGPDIYNIYEFKAWQGHTAEATMPARAVTYKAEWDSSANEYNLVVTFKRTDDTNVDAANVKLPTTVTMPVAVNGAYKIDLSASNYLVPGYTPNISMVSGNMPVGGVAVEVIYSPNANTKYTVRHVRESLDGSYNSSDKAVEGAVEVETLQGTTNAKTRAQAKVYEGFKAQEPEQIAIAADGSTVVTVKYSRNSYNVVWDAAGGVFGVGGSEKAIISTKYGAEIALPEKNPIRISDVSTAYEFLKWLDADNSEFAESTAMPAQTVYYHASWKTAGYPYTLTIQYEITDGHTELLRETYTETINTGKAYSYKSVNNADIFPVIPGYTADKTEISGTMPADNMTHTIKYTPNTGTKYTVIHHLQKVTGGTDKDTAYAEPDGEYIQGLTGTTNTTTELTAKTVNGFHVSTVNTWENANINADGKTVIHIYYDRNEHTVTWNAGDGYFLKDDGSKDEKTKTAKYLFGQTIVKPEKSPQKDSDNVNSYAFEKWTDYEDAVTMPNNDLTYHATWKNSERQYNFKIIYVLENGGSATVPTKHDVQHSTGAVYDVTAPSVPGFTPKSVSPTNASFSAESPKITGNMPAGDVTYTVTYEPNADTLYKAAIYLQNADGTYSNDANYTYDADNKFSDEDSVPYKGTTGTKTALTGKEYSYINYHLDTADGKGVQNVEILGVKADGNNEDGTTAEPVVVKIYYARDTYKLAWDFGGGTVSDSSTYTKGGDIRWDDAVTAPTTENTPELTKTGYTFDSWVVTLNPANADVKEIPQKMPLADVAIKAKWLANKYEITFVPGEGATISSNSSGLTNENKITVTYDSKYGRLPVASLADKIFQGWYTEKSGGTKITADTVVKLTAGISLYAQFGDNAPSGGTGTEPTPPSGGGGGGGGGGGIIPTPPDIVTNPDGSETKTETDASTGETVETTTYPNGNVIVKRTDKDGNVTIVETRKDGVIVETKIPAEGEVTAKVTLPTGMDKATVFIPCGNVTAGTVAVIVKPDGTEEIIKYCAATKDGMNVRVTGSVNLKFVDRSKSFADVTADFWGRQAIEFVVARDLFFGTTDTEFAPHGNMTRAMAMTVLARLNGQQTEGGEQWYSMAMEWAKQNNVSDGTNPEGSIVREQLVTMLFRFSGSPKVESDIDAFADAGSVSDYAKDAMIWAVKQGIINGTGNANLSPNAEATRAQVAAMIMRYIENQLS